MTLPPIVLYGGARRRRPTERKQVLNIDGVDISEALARAATSASVPVALVLACAIAESNLDPRAERWGHFTREARAALSAGDHARLQEIIDRAWPDISFGYGQRVVRYHWIGDRSRRVDNVLSVRQHVFDHPEEDLQQMALWLAGTLRQARTRDLTLVGGDELLGALVIYNAGHFPAPDEPYWHTHAGNVANYRRALQRAREIESPE